MFIRHIEETGIALVRVTNHISHAAYGFNIQIYGGNPEVTAESECIEFLALGLLASFHLLAMM